MESKVDVKLYPHVRLDVDKATFDMPDFGIGNKVADSSRRMADKVAIDIIWFAITKKSDKVYTVNSTAFENGIWRMDTALFSDKKEAMRSAKECGTNIMEYDLSHIYKKSDEEFEYFIADPRLKDAEVPIREYRKVMRQTTIHLSLCKKWFDMIASGVKKEEYRDIKAKYLEMFCEKLGTSEPNHSNDFTVGFHLHWPEHYDKVVFTLGYPKRDDNTRRLEFKNPKVRIDDGRPEWGAKPGKKYFVITWEEP